MKNLILVAGFITLLAIACNKSSERPTPPDPLPPVPKDTAVSGWTKIAVDTTYLVDIFFENAQTGYTGGKSLFKTNDGGSTWTRVMDVNLLGNIFVATGDQLHVLNLNPSVIYNFSNWATQKTTTSYIGQSLSGADLFFTDANTGFLTAGANFLGTIDGGASWSNFSAAGGLDMQNTYSTLFFINATTGWIANSRNIYSCNGTITQWTKAIISNPQPETLFSIFAASSTTIYAGASDGTVLKSTDGGIHFSKVYQFPTAVQGRFHDLHFIDANLGYACYDNRVYKTTDGGSSWTIEIGADGDNIIEIHFLDANHGWACTRGGKVWKYLVN